MNEEIFVYLDGPGGNGKSVFGKVISVVLGSYSCEIPTDAMTERDAHANGSKLERAKISVIGKRAAWANETSARDVFDDSAIKIMSSEDAIQPVITTRRTSAFSQRTSFGYANQ